MNFYGKKTDSIVESGHLIDRHRQPRDRDEAGTGHSARGLLGRGALPASLGPASRPPSLTPAFPPAVFQLSSPISVFHSLLSPPLGRRASPGSPGLLRSVLSEPHFAESFASVSFLGRTRVNHDRGRWQVWQRQDWKGVSGAHWPDGRLRQRCGST